MLATPRTTRPKPTQAIGWGQVLTPQSWQRSGVMVGGTQKHRRTESTGRDQFCAPRKGRHLRLPRMQCQANATTHTESRTYTCGQDDE